jgi:hypothetical protein
VDLARPRLKLEAERLILEPTSLIDANVSAFATEDPERVAIDYTITFKLDRTPSSAQLDRENPLGVVHGSGYFLPKDSELTDHYIQRIAIRSFGGYSARSYKDYDGAFAFPRPLPWE